MARAQPIKALAHIVETILWHDIGKNSDANKISIAFLNAQVAPGTFLENHDLTKKMICEQPFRPQYLQLERTGFQVSPDFSLSEHEQNENGGGQLDACLIVTGKFKSVNETMLQRAQNLVGRGGTVIVAGAKNTGISSLKKLALRDDITIESWSKFHSVVFWFANSGNLPSAERSFSRIIDADGQIYQTAAGLFSADRVDQGSMMLANHFDDKIKGKVADLGAGWGYLSAKLAIRSPDITAIELYEAHWLGLNASKINLKNIPAEIKSEFFWHDVASEPITGRYDWVVMNPPFHQGSDTSLELGTGFIEKSASILKPGGKLLMVANRQLSYEHTIGRHFSTASHLEEASGFKVILANK